MASAHNDEDMQEEEQNQQHEDGTPWIEILEEPKSTGLRFRYKCEGRSAGSIVGQSSTAKGPKVFPKIKIHGMGQAAVVVVSCVDKNKPYYPHPHSLVGTGCEDGVCVIKVKGYNVVQLHSVGIQCSKRHDVKDSLQTRCRLRVDPFGTGYPTTDKALKEIDLSSVRLCFQVFLPEDGTKKFRRVLTPVVSQEIVDKRLVNNLVICRLNKQAGCASGYDEVFLLCEKIKKDDIQVRFFEEDKEGNVSWEAFGSFQSQDLHRQCGLVFVTPPYRDEDIVSPVTVFIQLVRPSDQMAGDPKQFQYIPNTSVSQIRKVKDSTGRRKSLKRSREHTDLCSHDNNRDEDVGVYTPMVGSSQAYNTVRPSSTFISPTSSSSSYSPPPGAHRGLTSPSSSYSPPPPSGAHGGLIPMTVSDYNFATDDYPSTSQQSNSSHFTSTLEDNYPSTPQASDPSYYPSTPQGADLSNYASSSQGSDPSHYASTPHEDYPLTYQSSNHSHYPSPPQDEYPSTPQCADPSNYHSTPQGSDPSHFPSTPQVPAYNQLNNGQNLASMVQQLQGYRFVKSTADGQLIFMLDQSQKYNQDNVGVVESDGSNGGHMTEVLEEERCESVEKTVR